MEFTIDLLAEFLESAINGLLLCTLIYSFMSDDSSIIPSSIPTTQPLDVNEITIHSRLDSFIKDSLRHNDGCLAISVYKEKGCILGLVVVWCQTPFIIPSCKSCYWELKE